MKAVIFPSLSSPLGMLDTKLRREGACTFEADVGNEYSRQILSRFGESWYICLGTWHLPWMVQTKQLQSPREQEVSLFLRVPDLLTVGSQYKGKQTCKPRKHLPRRSDPHKPVAQVMERSTWQDERVGSGWGSVGKRGRRHLVSLVRSEIPLTMYSTGVELHELLHI